MTISAVKAKNKQTKQIKMFKSNQSCNELTWKCILSPDAVRMIV